MSNIFDRIKWKSSAAGFVLTVGSTVNMDGKAIYQAVAAVFIANASGICPGIDGQVIIVVMTLLAFTGTAGVPGEGLFTSAIE